MIEIVRGARGEPISTPSSTPLALIFAWAQCKVQIG